MSRTTGVPPGDDRYDHFVNDKIDDYPNGYPRLAAFVSSDAEGRMYRRFAYLRSRLLLYYQDEIECLEASLAKLDAEHAASDPARLHSRHFDERKGEESERKDLVKTIDERLEHYDRLLLREDRILRVFRPPRSLHRQYFNWTINHKPVVRPEYSFIYHENDFVSLGIDEDSWLGPFIKDLGRMMPNWLLKVCFFLSTKKDTERSADDAFFFSDSRTEKLVKGVLGITAALSLLLPIVVFYLLTVNNVSGGARIGALCAFVIAFNAILLLMTRISKQELFGASAAYCAVLVVFLGNIPQQKLA